MVREVSLRFGFLFAFLFFGGFSSFLSREMVSGRRMDDPFSNTSRPSHRVSHASTSSSFTFFSSPFFDQSGFFCKIQRTRVRTPLGFDCSWQRGSNSHTPGVSQVKVKPSQSGLTRSGHFRAGIICGSDFIRGILSVYFFFLLHSTLLLATKIFTVRYCSIFIEIFST